MKLLNTIQLYKMRELCMPKREDCTIMQVHGYIRICPLINPIEFQIGRPRFLL